MLDCWRRNPVDRPHFSVIHEKLEDLANSKVVSSSAHVMLFCELPQKFAMSLLLHYNEVVYVCLALLLVITSVLYTSLQNLLDFQNYDMYIYSQFEEPVALSTVL